MIKVLIVDDEYIMRQGLKYMIDWEREGYEIVGEAANGKDALDLIEQEKPHIIISDIVMPMLDGVDFSDVVHRLYPQVQMIILSGYDNFEYVKKTFQSGVTDYILKPTLNQDELLTVLSKARDRLPSYQRESGDTAGASNPGWLLEKYLLGIGGEQTYSLPQSFSRSRLCFFGVNIKKESRQGDALSDVLYHKIERFFTSHSEYESILCMLREELACVLICFDSSSTRALHDGLSELSEQLSLLCEDILAVCSRAIHASEAEKLKELYISDIAANVEKAFYHEGEHVLFIERAPENVDDTTEKFDYFKYNQMLWSNRYRDAADMLMAYSEGALAARMDSYRIKNQIENMIFHFIDSLSISDDERDEFRKRSFSRIKSARYEREYRECVTDIITELNSLSEDEYLQDDNRVKKILEYILDNYREDLKLENLAEEFNFNYHYLSTYFNKHLKEGFSDYLNRIRIEKACELLLESDMSIAGVSSEVGYSEHSYFCRVFKKITGDTPSAWRRKQHEK